MHHDTEIKVYENTDPLVVVTLTVEDTGLPYDLTGATAIEFFIKDGGRQTDAQAVKYSLGGGQVAVVGLGSAGKVSVQFSAADLDRPGERRWKLDVIKNGKRETVALGPLFVDNT